MADFDKIGGHRHRAFFAPDQFEQSALVVQRQLAPGHRHDKGERGQPLLAVRRADHQDIADGRVRTERLVTQHRTLDLFGPHAVARHVDDVVAAAVQREGAVIVSYRKIALSVGPRAAPALPVTVDPPGSIAAPPALYAAVFDTEIVDIAPDGAREIRIGRGNDDLAFFSDVGAPPRHTFVARSLKSCIPTRPVGILNPDIADDPGQGIGVRIGLQREIVVAIKMRPGDAAMLGCPIAVDILRHDMPHAERLNSG